MKQSPRMKNWLALVLCVLLALCSVAASAETFTAAAMGNNGPVSLDVVIEDGRIISVNIASHTETSGISDGAFAQIPQAIVDNQSVAVDAVTGATNTTNAILDAVKDCLTQAGLNVADYEIVAAGTAGEATAQAQDVTLDCDVVIIGAGGAGLAAAITAEQLGAKIIIVEKMPYAGGNTLLSGGYYNAVDPTRQQAGGIEDSVEKHIQQTYEGGDMVANLELVTKLCSEATDGLLWLESMGMKFNVDVTTATGALWPRSHKAVEPNGSGYIKVYLNELEGKNAEILYEVKAEEIVMSDGRAVGIKAVGADGSTYTINGAKGVIIASGGFGSNVEMRQFYNTVWPTLDESVVSSNSVASTGDGIVMAEAVGANLVGMEYIQLHPLGNPVTGNFSGVVSGDVEQYIQVNLEGRRYVAEDSRRDVLCKAALEQEGGLMWQISDSFADAALAEASVSGGYGVKADTFEELAVLMEVDPQVLTETIEVYNQAVETGSDELGRTILVHKMDTPPYYAAKRSVTVHHTMGGIQINTEAQVIDTEGNIIPGLFAAGEVTGGIMGSNRLGGNALADTVVFGRTAGRNVMNED